MKKILGAFSVCTLLILTACGGGGGGGGGSFVGGANLLLSASPTKLDTGNRTKVEIELSEIHENGVAVKLQYPKGLSYVSATTFLEVGEQEIDVDPLIEATNNANKYLVVVIIPDLLGNKESATLTVELRADEATDGEIGVDADVLPADIDPANYVFDVESPEYTAEDSVEIEIHS